MRSKLMAKKNKKAEVFEYKGKSYCILNPTSQINEDASMEYNRIFSKALRNGALLRESLDSFMRDQNLWDDSRQEEYTGYLQQITEKERQLKLGGIKLSEAKQIAIEIRALRAISRVMIEHKNSLDVNTAQGQAENARFNYLLINCLVYNDEEDNGQFRRVYSSMDEFNADEAEDSVGVEAAGIFARIYFGLEKDYEHNLPENKFLREYKFSNNEDHLVDEQGRTVDYEGRLVDENLRFVDENGEFVDIRGDRIDEEGNPVGDRFSPFLDDKGKPISENQEEESKESKEKEPPKKRRGRPKKQEQKTDS